MRAPLVVMTYFNPVHHMGLETFAARASILYKDYDGYNYNATRRVKEGNMRTIAGRLTFVWQPSDNFDATLVLDSDNEEGSGASMRNAGLPGNTFAALSPNVLTAVNDDPYVTYGNLPIFSKVDTWGAMLEMNYNLGSATITSVTGYREFDDNIASDYDASASTTTYYHGERLQTHQQFSEELRVASNGDGPLNYVAGVYYLNQSYAISNDQKFFLFVPALNTSLPIINGAQVASQDNTAVAVFAQLDYNVTPELVLTAGGRYSYEEKEFTNDPIGVRKSVGYMPDNFGVYDGMKVWEFLDFFAVAYEIPRTRRKAVIGDVLELLDLTPDAPEKEMPPEPEVHVMTQPERFADAFDHQTRRQLGMGDPEVRKGRHVLLAGFDLLTGRIQQLVHVKQHGVVVELQLAQGSLGQRHHRVALEASNVIGRQHPMVSLTNLRAEMGA